MTFIPDPRARIGHFIRVVSSETAPNGMVRVVTCTGRELSMTAEKLAAEIEAAKVPRNHNPHRTGRR